MILIIGGSYQGKLEYARQRFSLADADIFFCSETVESLDFNRRCIAYVDRWALNCVRRDTEPADVLRGDLDRLRDAIVIANDISCGVVPADAGLRAWREACGRLNLLLAGAADEVWRLFCGLPQQIK